MAASGPLINLMLNTGLAAVIVVGHGVFPQEL